MNQWIIELNKEVVLFTRMPNFASFNCIFCWIVWQRIPYANLFMHSSSHRQILYVSCNFCWILQFCKQNARSRSKHNCTFLALRQEESNTWRSIIKEISTSSRDKTVWVSNFILPNLHIWVCGKTVRRRFHW